jgi:hypothetical protein
MALQNVVLLVTFSVLPFKIFGKTLSPNIALKCLALLLHIVITLASNLAPD